MKKNYSVYGPQLGRSAAWLLLLAVAGCKNETEVQPNQGPEYYPLEVGSYRIYDVADTTWRNNVPTASRFQFREQVATEPTLDATGQSVYQVIRSRRATPADAWAVDSVITVTMARQFLSEQRGNRRSVELIFPAQEGKTWSNVALYAPDTAKTVDRTPTRIYQNIGQAFSVARSGKTYSYDNTLTTQYAGGIPGDICKDVVMRTTYAKGVGPVYRVLRYFDHRLPGTCEQTIKVLGRSRNEVLIESGK